MSNQAQVDALEHLLLAVLRRHRMSLSGVDAIEDALSSILGSDGPGGPREKEAAAEYLRDFRSRIER